MLREWGVLGKANPSGSSFGGFVGYNTQWSDVIVGIDLHYNRSDFFANAPAGCRSAARRQRQRHQL